MAPKTSVAATLLDPGRPRLAAVAIAAAVILVWLAYTPAGALGKANALGYAVCHQIELRSFHLGARPLPLCARCTGMYLGALGMMIALAVVGRMRAGRFPPRRVLFVIGGLSLPFVVDGTNSFLHLFDVGLHLYEPVNWLRLATGLLLGMALGMVVLVGFNQNAWRRPGGTAPIESLAQLLPAVGLMALLGAAVLTENPMVLYPLALASGAGVLVLLTTVHTTLVLLIGRRENQADSWRDLIGPISLGLALATLQVGGIDLLRYIATGSWSGFTL